MIKFSPLLAGIVVGCELAWPRDQRFCANGAHLADRRGRANVRARFHGRYQAQPFGQDVGR